MNCENVNDSQLKLFEQFNSKRTSYNLRSSLRKQSSKVNRLSIGVPLKQNQTLSKISISQTSSDMNPLRQMTDNFHESKFNSNQSDLSLINNIQFKKHINKYPQKKSLDATKRPSMIQQYEKVKNINTLAKISQKTIEKSHYGSLLSTLKIYDYSIGVLSIICIIVAIGYNEQYSLKSFDYINEIIKKENKELTRDAFHYINQRVISSIENIIAIINIVISLILCIIIYFRYIALMHLLINEDRLCEYDNLISSGLIKKLIRDELFAIIFIPPYINTGYTLLVGKTQVSVISLNHILSICQLLKLIFAVRAISHLSKWKNSLAMGICSNLKVQNNYSFIIKCEIAYRPLLFLPCFFLIILLIFMVIIRPFEYFSLKENGNLKNKELRTGINCMWIVVEAMLKIGYGEYTLNSFLCSIAIFFAYLFGSSIFGLFIYSLYQLIKFKPEEEKAFGKLNKLFSKDNIEHKAVGVIKYLLFLRKLQKKQQESTELSKTYRLEKYHLLLMFAKHIKGFKNEYTVSHSYFMPITELLIRTQQRVLDDVYLFNETLFLCENTENDLHSIQLNQEKIQFSLHRISTMYKKVMKYIIQENNNRSIENHLKKPPYVSPRPKIWLNDKNLGVFSSFSGLPIKTKKKHRLPNTPSNHTKESQTPKADVVLQKRKQKRGQTQMHLVSRQKSHLKPLLQEKIHSLYSCKKSEDGT